MAISDNYVPVKELGNGVTVDYGANWAVLANTFLRVFLEDVTTGVQTPVDEGGASDEYTLVFDASGFTATFNTAPTSANYVVIGREVAETQTVPYKTSKGFQGSVQENSFDKLTAIDQDQSDEITRSLKFQLGSSAVGSMPTPVDDLILNWDGATGAIKNSVKTMTEVEDAVDAVEALSAGSGVLVSANDTTVGFLNGKLTAGDAISLTEANDGGNETLAIAVPDDAITLAKMAGGVDGNLISYDANGDPVAVATGTAGQVLTSAGVGAPPTMQTPATGGKVLGQAYTSISSVISTTNLMPFDDTIPQNTEGVEVLTLAYTPVSATSKLVITCGYFASSDHNEFMSSALFVDATADALCATDTRNETGAAESDAFTYEETSASLTLRTYKLRIGGALAGTITLNGSSAGARRFGGVAQTYIKIIEIEV